MMLEKELIYHEYVQRENEFVRADYQPEFEFYNAVGKGDIEKVKVLLEDSFSNKEGLGRLSQNPLQNLKYHFAITAAMLARYCIEGGMEMSDSYSLSDFYIQKADIAKTDEEITELHKLMTLDYTKKMRGLNKRKITSMPVARAIDYIYDHLHTRITLEVLSNYVNLNPSYLSRVFKKETGLSVTRYIRIKKLETARNMLIYSDFTSADISSILAFPSQSYFTDVFHKEFGMTPMEYRNKNLFNSELVKEVKKST
ncbi:MAG: AraC family transcriptional regulator [Eubacterium sp.]|nr:AraC family transcriptional regulator [Eubacterium sp.]